MNNSLSSSTQLSMTVNMNLISDKKPIEQFGSALPSMVNDLVKNMAWQWGKAQLSKWLDAHPDCRYEHENTRRVLTVFGEVVIPNAEIRQGRKYIGKTSQLVFGLEKKQKALHSAQKVIRSIVTILSFRKGSNFLKIFFGNISSQRIHKIWRSLEKQIDDVIRVETTRNKSYDVKRILAWMDGWCIKTRQCRGAEVIRNTLRIVIARITINDKKIWKIASGFIEHSYIKLFSKAIPRGLRSETIVLSDGERAITESLVDPRSEAQTKMIADPETGEILYESNTDKEVKQAHIVEAIQRCLFHFTYNIIAKAISGGMKRTEAEDLSDNLKSLTYFSKSVLRKIKEDWEQVIKERINVLHWLCDNLKSKKHNAVANSINRAIPYLFTYVKYYCEDGFFIGRTTNKLENLFRQTTYRLKRIGAVWSPKGAQQMVKYIFAQHFKYRFPAPVNPLLYHIECCVVKC